MKVVLELQIGNPVEYVKFLRDILRAPKSGAWYEPGMLWLVREVMSAVQKGLPEPAPETSPEPEPTPVSVLHVPMDRLDHTLPKLLGSLLRIQRPRADYAPGDELLMAREVIACNGKEARDIECRLRDLFPGWFENKVLECRLL